ncbi:phage tail protein [Wolbachia endosymbiont (group A) of Ectemnius continuus]|uniref:phage tail protein n=1 Tax=Wolbachia endosymbiont (group A) of Ectemnius continuus TaxID=2954002 RepID=UPI00223128AB|nr:phage tail protein [Wolbachia endosymbiont (group A) of Ectemnius continuus]
MLSLGPYKISPTSLKYSKEKRWSVVECIGKQLLQNIGQGAENIDLEGTTYLHNLSELKNVKETEENQIPHTLVDSMGNVLGQFVITRFEEKLTSFFPCGLPKKVEFNLSLRRYL